MAEVQPLQWTPQRPAPSATEQMPHLFYTAPGGWAIVWDEDRRRVAGTPWKLVRHGGLVAWCHTLRIGKMKAAQIVLRERGEPTRD